DEDLLAPVRRAGHGANRRALACAALGIDPRALRCFGSLVGPMERNVATEQHAALTFEARAQCVTQGANASDDGDTERDTGDEHIESAQAAAELAHGQTQHERQLERKRAWGGRCSHAHARATSRVSATILPSRMD